jgi:hypothetical protein
MHIAHAHSASHTRTPGTCCRSDRRTLTFTCGRFALVRTQTTRTRITHTHARTRTGRQHAVDRRTRDRVVGRTIHRTCDIDTHARTRTRTRTHTHLLPAVNGRGDTCRAGLSSSPTRAHTHTHCSLHTTHRTMLPADQPDMTTTCQTDYFIVRPMRSRARTHSAQYRHLLYASDATATACWTGLSIDHSLASTRTRRTRAPHAHARLDLLSAVNGRRFSETDYPSRLIYCAHALAHTRSAHGTGLSTRR